MVGGGRRRFAFFLGGVQLAVDTTLVSALKGDGEPSRGAADRDGVALAEARRTKERTCSELVGPGSRARLVVLALEVGGRWSEEAKIFVRLLARARARNRDSSVEVAVVRDHCGMETSGERFHPRNVGFEVARYPSDGASRSSRVRKPWKAEASLFPSGNSPSARPHKVVRGVCASCSETSFLSRGGGDRSCGASRPHEGGVRRGPTQISKSASRGAETHLRQFIRWDRWRSKSADCGNMWRVGRDQCCSRTSSMCPRQQGLGLYRPYRHSCWESSFTWLEDRQTDLQEALISGDTSRVLELASKMTEGAEHLREITSVPEFHGDSGKLHALSHCFQDRVGVW